jgi:hypothetical protein
MGLIQSSEIKRLDPLKAIPDTMSEDITRIFTECRDRMTKYVNSDQTYFNKDYRLGISNLIVYLMNVIIDYHRRVVALESRLRQAEISR